MFTLLDKVQREHKRYLKAVEKAQIKYLKRLRKDIIEAARNGKTSVTTFRLEDASYYGYNLHVSRRFLYEIKDLYERKGFNVEVVHPKYADNDPLYEWLRISWEVKNEKSEYQANRIC